MFINNLKQNIYHKNSNFVAFKGHQKLSLHMLRTLKDVTCVYCGERMLVSSEIVDFSQKAAKLEGMDLARYLVSMRPNMRPNEKKAACIIKEELKRHPSMDLKAVLGILFPRHIEKLEKQQEKVLLELQKIAVDFPEHDRLVTKAQIEKGLEGIKKSDEMHFRRNKYISEFFMLSDKYEDFGNYIKIIEAIKAMPNSHTSTDAFIVKYSRKSSKDIATRLLSPSQVTIEHLKPRSYGGTNILSNIVLACGCCNSSRRSNPLETMPNLSVNLPNYFRTLRKALADRLPKQEFARVEDYVCGVKETINNLLKNGLNIFDPSKGRYF